MDEERVRELSLPLDQKPFRVRTEEGWALRQDVYVGVSCCVPLLSGYLFDAWGIGLKQEAEA